ncbi:uncharacterized protein DNG_03354 [Cephalotrichum gorgonifer]|uniref:SsuA/THI5-like domain-containing protein n=1 Tax=Cephalotrichum gorgonifer TaxID=2041049 RepID=A0AAE8MWE5_9PEZI|nr:uncharacterized protein DNG_03354 [Cephalotrichum gorgonifer]
MKHRLCLVGALSTLILYTTALRIATSLQWIEHTPQRYAIEHFYNGSSRAQLVSGGVNNLVGDNSFDLAANAETQGLRQLNGRRSLRLIYIICEAQYRIVADRTRGIEAIGDLRGKRIGTIPGTSAGYFVSKLLGVSGIQPNQYSVVSGNACMRAPCGQGTFPQMMQGRQIDAFGLWEPAAEISIRNLGDNAVVFQNGSVYREIYSLYSTEEKLANPSIRADIVEFVRALEKTLEVYNDPPEGIYAEVAPWVGMDADVLKGVWKEHLWTGAWDDWAEEFVEYLVEEDAYLARDGNRRPIPRADIEAFLDTSVLAEL